MILINLLPEELRVREKIQVNLPLIKIGLIAGLLLGLLTVGFYFDFLLAQFKLKRLEKEFKVILPQSQQLKQLEDDVEQKLKPENSFLNRFVTAERPLTFLLAWTSEFLPPSGWLTELKLTREGEGGRLFLKGLALPTKEQSSIEQIELYLHQLKEKMPDANLSLTTSRQKIQNTEVTEFIANFDWGLAAPAKP